MPQTGQNLCSEKPVNQMCLPEGKHLNIQSKWVSPSHCVSSSHYVSITLSSSYMCHSTIMLCHLHCVTITLCHYHHHTVSIILCVIITVLPSYSPWHYHTILIYGPANIIAKKLSGLAEFGVLCHPNHKYPSTSNKGCILPDGPTLLPPTALCILYFKCISYLVLLP